MNYDTISTDDKEAFLGALRCGLHNEKLTLSANIDIEKLLYIAAHQNLFPFVFLSLMSNKEFESTTVYQKYLPQFLASFSMQVRRTESFLELYPRFSEKGIYPVVVKGIVCRHLYGEFADCRPSGDEDMGYRTRALEDTNSKYFLSDMIRIGNRYLGFSIEPLCGEKDSEELLDDFLCMGVFGNSTEVHATAGRLTSVTFSEGNTMLRIIFPSKDWLTKRFPELIDRLYLLPVCWFKRWLLFLKSRKSGDSVIDSKSMALGKKRIALMKKYEVL